MYWFFVIEFFFIFFVEGMIIMCNFAGHFERDSVQRDILVRMR